MDKLIESIIELVANSPPDRLSQLAVAIGKLSSPSDAHALSAWAVNPAAQARLANLSKAWLVAGIPANELSGMLIGASSAYRHAKSEQQIELVWTGPSSQLIATRKTEQALLEVIAASSGRLFMTSFVAYDVASIMKALTGAIGRGVKISMLLEASDKHGGGVSIDAIGKMKVTLPAAQIYSWAGKDSAFIGGKVHAKVAVADETICFISSANLTGHAMEKNMEAGVLITGGITPQSLHRHLEALVTTQVITRV